MSSGRYKWVQSLSEIFLKVIQKWARVEARTKSKHNLRQSHLNLKKPARCMLHISASAQIPFLCNVRILPYPPWNTCCLSFRRRHLVSWYMNTAHVICPDWSYFPWLLLDMIRHWQSYLRYQSWGIENLKTYKIFNMAYYLPGHFSRNIFFSIF